jgi:hypothetical protein
MCISSFLGLVLGTFGPTSLLPFGLAEIQDLRKLFFPGKRLRRFVPRFSLGSEGNANLTKKLVLQGHIVLKTSLIVGGTEPFTTFSLDLSRTSTTISVWKYP